jgi:hypothetical protein
MNMGATLLEELEVVSAPFAEGGSDDLVRLMVEQ